MKKPTKEKIIKFIKNWKCGSADRNKVLDEWEQDYLIRLFKFTKKEKEDFFKDRI